MNSKSNTLRVFLCHSVEDKSTVRGLYDRLSSLGIDVWLDEMKLLPGQDWDIEIRKAIKFSHVVIICLSNLSVKKIGYVQTEIHRALDIATQQPEGSIFIIPLRLEECEVPFRLQPFHWVDFFLEGGYEKLVASIRARADELGLSLFAIQKLLDSVRSAMENLDYASIATAVSILDVSILPADTLRELSDALMIASTQISSTSSGVLIIHSKLVACLERLIALTPSDMMVQIKLFGAKFNYSYQLYESGQYDMAIDEIATAMKSKILHLPNPLWKTQIKNTQLIYVKALQRLSRFQEVIDFIDKNKKSLLDPADLAMWVIFSICKARSLEKVSDINSSKIIISQITEHCLAFKDPALGADALLGGAKIYREFDDYNENIPILKYVLEISNNPKNNNMQEHNALTLYRLAQSYRKIEDYNNAIGTCNDLVEHFSNTDNPDIEGYLAWGLVELERSLCNAKRFEDSFKTAQQILDRYKDSDSATIKSVKAWARLENISAHRYSGDLSGALEIIAEFLELYDLPVENKGVSLSRQTDYNHELAYAFIEKAFCLRSLGKPELAISTLNSLLERLKSVSDRDVKNEIIYGMMEKAHILMRSDNFEDGIALCESIIPSCANENGYYYRRDFEFVICGMGIGRLFQAKQAFKKGENDKAISLLAEAEGLFFESNSISRSSDSLGGIGYISFLRKDYARAQEFISEAYNRYSGLYWLNGALADINVFPLSQDEEFKKMLLMLNDKHN